MTEQLNTPEAKARERPFGRDFQPRLRAQIALITISFSIGFFSLISQVSFFREILVVFYGNELCIGIIFAIWLAGIFFGAFIASFGKSKAPHLVIRTALLLILLIIATPFQLFLIRLSRIIFSTPPGEYIPFLHITMICFLFVFPISMIVGAFFPLAAKLFSSEGDLKATAVTTLYVWEAIGSLLGGIIFTFAFIPYFNIFDILALSSIIPLLSIAILAYYQKGRFASRWLLILTGIFIISLTALFLINFPDHLQRWTANERWKSFAGEIEKVAEKDTKYQNICIGRQADLFSIYTNGQYDTSFPDLYQSALTAHLVMTEHPHPERLLIIGGGFTGIIEEVLKYPVKKVDYVELDPALIPIAFKYLPESSVQALSDPRVTVHHLDGRYYIKSCSSRYDIILLNSMDPSTAVSNRYYTSEFFQEAKSKLNQEGLFVTSISSSENYFGPDMLGYVASVYHSIQSVFKYVVLSPTERAFFFASDSKETPTSDIDLLQERFLQRNISSPFFTELAFQMLFPSERVSFVKESLENVTRKEINTDIRPVTYFYSLKLWARFSGSRIQKLLVLFESHGKKIWIIFLVALFSFFATRMLLAKNRNTIRIKSFVTLCITSTGFAGMAWSLILIFSFQNVMGYLYSEMGILVALFMFGISIGGIMMRTLDDKFHEETLIFLADAAAFLYSFLLLFFLLRLYAMNVEASLFIESFFSILMFFAGFLTGFEFPVSVRLYLSVSGDIRKAAGFIDASDHLGAALGALFTGVLFLPLGGLWLSTLAIGSLKFISLIILLMGILLRKMTSR
jgi:spermidine synthase